jgi:hypothetical protein
MDSFRLIKINRKMPNRVIEDINFRRTNKRNCSNACSNDCYICSLKGPSESPSGNFPVVGIHKDCQKSLIKCSHNDCPQYFKSECPRCIQCSLPFCYTHIIGKSICYYCNEMCRINAILVLLKTPLYDNVDVLKNIISYFPSRIFEIWPFVKVLG